MLRRKKIRNLRIRSWSMFKKSKKLSFNTYIVVFLKKKKRWLACYRCHSVYSFYSILILYFYYLHKKCYCQIINLIKTQLRLYTPRMFILHQLWCFVLCQSVVCHTRVRDITMIILLLEYDITIPVCTQLFQKN